jgi:hypothetical protein
VSYTRDVPHAALTGRVETAVAAAVEQHRAELAELVEQRVEAELERLVDELVADAIAGRNGAAPRGAPSAATVQGDDVDEHARIEQAEELLRCSTCGRLRRSTNSAATRAAAAATAAGAARSGASASTRRAHDELAAKRRRRLHETTHGTTRSLDR